MTQAFMKRSEVVAMVGLGYTTIWRLERAGKFPARRKLTSYRVGWLRAEVEGWIQEREAVPNLVA